MKKIWGLSLTVLRSQLVAIFLCFMLMLIFGGLAEKFGITGVLSILIWIGVYYSVGWNKGKKDSRKIKGVSPDIKSNAVAGLVCSLVTFLLLIVRVLAFHVAAGGQIGQKSLILDLADIVYRLWNFPFIDYMQNGTLLSYFIPVLVPFIVYIVSYIIGLKRFSIVEKVLPRIIYKKKHE